MSTRQEISTWIASAPDAVTADNRIEMAIDALGLVKSRSLNVRRTALNTFLRANPANETGWNIPGAPTPAPTPAPAPTTPAPAPTPPALYELEEFMDGGLFGLPGITVRAVRVVDGPIYRVLDRNGFRVGTWNADTQAIQSLLVPTPTTPAAPTLPTGDGHLPPNPHDGGHGGDSWWSTFYNKFNVRGSGGEHH